MKLSCAMIFLFVGFALAQWPLTTSNSWITDVPTVFDFVPLGVEFIETTGSQLLWNGPKWRLSCFIAAGIGITPTGDTILFQLRIPHPTRGSLKDCFPDMFYYRGSWRKFYRNCSPCYFVERSSRFSYPTYYVYGTYSSGDSCIQSMSYDTTTRRWIYRVHPLHGHGDTVEIIMRPRGVTYWMGKPRGPYIIHGAIFNRPEFDIWGGFWELCEVVGKIVILGSGTWNFVGNCIWDRAYHLVYYSDTAAGHAGAPLAFTCGYVFDDSFQLAFAHADNPSPLTPPVTFQHQGRLYLPSRGLSLRFDRFTFSDNGGLQPTQFYIDNDSDSVIVHLTGDPILFYPRVWGIGNNIWWDSTAQRTWGRVFLHWHGQVIVGTDTMNIENAFGVIEATRYQPGSKIGNESTALPNNLAINIYPNPFNKYCAIKTNKELCLEIYDITGKLVKKLNSNENCDCGNSTGGKIYYWQPENSTNSGIYFLVARPKSEKSQFQISEVKKLVYIK